MITDATIQENATRWLRKHLRPGATVYCTVGRRNSNGMSRSIIFTIPLIVSRNGRRTNTIHNIGSTITDALGGIYKRDKSDDALVVGGCGMDMGFAVVARLSKLLYPDGAMVPGLKFKQSRDIVITHKWLA